MRHSLLLATIGLGVMLSGCASMNKDECLTANWQDIGREDGIKGESRTHISEHRSACAEYKVTPDSQAYLKGYEEGIRQFCVPNNGLTVGLAGNNYAPQSCPPDMEPAFLTQYNYGHKLHEVNARIEHAKSEIESKESQLEAARAPGVRASLRSEISSLDRQIRTLQSEEETLRANPPK